MYYRVGCHILFLFYEDRSNLERFKSPIRIAYNSGNYPRPTIITQTLYFPSRRLYLIIMLSERAMQNLPQDATVIRGFYNPKC